MARRGQIATPSREAESHGESEREVAMRARQRANETTATRTRLRIFSLARYLGAWGQARLSIPLT